SYSSLFFLLLALTLLVMHCFSSCFYHYGYHCYLHSFPTRRSSDLCPVNITIKNNIPAVKAIPFAPFAAPYIDKSKKTATKIHEGDRKSTRLNSSHVSISYAVFCLKKKSDEHRTPGDRGHALPASRP